MDYIKRAVELADGAEWFTDYAGTDWVCIQSHEFLPDDQAGLDALAAQLVRQVDALGLEFTATNKQSRVWPEEARVPVYVNGPDRTMNTIKAIVDSGVLG